MRLTDLLPTAKKVPGQVAAAARQAAQDWLPLEDLREACLIRPDGAAVGGIAVSPLNLTLKSEAEKRAVISAVVAAINGMNVPWQILSVERPVDLDSYLAALDAQMAGASRKRREGLRDYTAWVHGLARSGRATERRYYIQVIRTGPDALAEHRTGLAALAEDLRRAQGLQAQVMDPAAWRELLFLTFRAEHAATETVPDGLRIPPSLKGGGQAVAV